MKQGFIALAIALLISGPAYADNEPVQEPRGEQRRPPAEAVEACASSVAGNPCSSVKPWRVTVRHRMASRWRAGHRADRRKRRSNFTDPKAHFVGFF